MPGDESSAVERELGLAVAGRTKPLVDGGGLFVVDLTLPALEEGVWLTRRAFLLGGVGLSDMGRMLSISEESSADAGLYLYEISENSSFLRSSYLASLDERSRLDLGMMGIELALHRRSEGQVGELSGSHTILVHSGTPWRRG